MALPFDPAASAGPVAGGRSIWHDALSRLRRNRAALASAVYLVLMGLACAFGPLVSPHGFDHVYQEYVRMPAALAPYPRPEQVAPTIERALKRARLTVADLWVAGTAVTIKVTATRKIDPRSGVYLDRTEMFGNSRITSMADDGLSATIATDIVPRHFLFGTDSNGRDLFTRTLLAGRVSLTIGLLAASVAILIGVTYGAVSGYLGGRADLLMMRFVDVLYSLPFIFFVILLVVFFGRNIVLMFLAVGAVEWLDMARIVRGQTLSLKRQEFVQAAEALGVDGRGILRRHIIPNLLGPVVVFVTLTVPRVILLESFLSFLGLGVQEPMTSWGVLISEGAKNIQGAAWMLVFPSLFLTSTLFALNFLGDGLRDALDPRDR
jgi:oligopeptide transport system permease protein